MSNWHVSEVSPPKTIFFDDSTSAELGWNTTLSGPNRGCPLSLISREAGRCPNGPYEDLAASEPVNGTVKLMGSEVCGGKERSDGSDDKRDCFCGVRSVSCFVCKQPSYHDRYDRGLTCRSVGRVGRRR